MAHRDGALSSILGIPRNSNFIPGRALWLLVPEQSGGGNQSCRADAPSPTPYIDARLTASEAPRLESPSLPHGPSPGPGPARSSRLRHAAPHLVVTFEDDASPISRVSEFLPPKWGV